MQEFKNFTHDAVVLLKKNQQKKVNGDLVPLIVNCKGLESQPVTWESSPVICIFSVFSYEISTISIGRLHFHFLFCCP